MKKAQRNKLRKFSSLICHKCDGNKFWTFFHSAFWKRAILIEIIIKMTLEHNSNLSNSTKEIFIWRSKTFCCFSHLLPLMMMERANYTIKLRHSDELIRLESILVDEYTLSEKNHVHTDNFRVMFSCASIM